MKKTINKKSVAPLSVLTKIFAGLLALNFAVISPAVYAIGASPLRHVLKAKPGETIEATIIVTNTSDSKILVTGEKADFVMTETEDLKFYSEADPENIYSLQNWISFVENDIPVEANEQTELRYNITVPQNAASQAYYGVIYVGGKNPPSTQETTGSIGVGLQTQVAHLVLLEVEGDLKTTLDLTNYTVEKPEGDENTLNFITKYYNSGNTHQAPGGKIIITDAEKYSLQELEVNKGKYNNLPELPKTVVTQYKPEELKPGIYYAYYLATDTSGKELAAELKYQVNDDSTVSTLETNMDTKYIAPEPKVQDPNNANGSNNAVKSQNNFADYNNLIFGLTAFGLIMLGVLYIKVNKKNKPHKHILQIKKHKKEHKKVHHKKTGRTKNNKKKKIFKIFTLLIAIFAGFETANTTLAAAQDASNLTLSTTIDGMGGCTWSGAPWASTLIVLDDTICYIEGTGRTALAVDVRSDTNGINQAGGKLVVGANYTNTAFTVSGAIDIKGILEVGVAGPHIYNSSLSTTSGGDLNINTGGTATVLSNSTGDHSISIVDQINVGNATTTGTLTLSDASTNTGYQMTVYGTVGVSDATLNISTGGITIYGSGQISNYTTVTNSGALVMNTNGVINNVGTFTNSSFVTLSGNSNIVNGSTATFNLNAATTADASIILNDTSSIDNAGTFTIKGHIALYGTSDFTNADGGNPSTLTIDDNSTYVNYIQLNSTATFNNNAGATTTVGKTTTVDGEIRLYNTSVFTNNSTVNTDKTFLQGDAEALASRSKLDNYGTFNTNRLRSGNDSLWGGLFYGKSGSTLNVDGLGGSVYITNAGRIINEDGGQIIIDGYVADVTGKSAAAETQKSIISNAATAGSAFTVVGNINLNGYSKIDNAGMFYNGGNLTMINDANITNGSTATFDMNGSGVSTANLTMSNTSTIENAGTFEINSTAVLNGSATITNSDSGAAATFTVDDGSTVANSLTLNTSSTFNNNTGATLYIGIGTATDGQLNIYNSSIFNNFNITTIRGTTGSTTITQGGTFNNKADAVLTSKALTVGNATAVMSTLQQDEGSGTGANVVATTITVGQYGKINSADYITASSTFTISSSFNSNYGYFGNAGTLSNSKLEVASTASISGNATIAANATAAVAGATTIGSAGILNVNGTFTSTYTGGYGISVNGGKLYTGNATSVLDMSSSGTGIYGSTGVSTYIELAGLYNGKKTVTIDWGYLCIGHYNSGNGACENSGITSDLVSITGTNSITHYTDIKVANSLQLGSLSLDSGNGTVGQTTTFIQNSTSTNITVSGDVTIQNRRTSFTSNSDFDIPTGILLVKDAATANFNASNNQANQYTIGSIQMLSTSAIPASSSIFFGQSGATYKTYVTIADSHACAVTTDECAIELNHLNNTTLAGQNTYIYMYGDMIITGATPKLVYVGITNATQPMGVANFFVVATANFDSSFTNSTTGDFNAGYNSSFISENSSTHVTDINLSGRAYFNSIFHSYIYGTFDCETLLHVQSNGILHILKDAYVKVNGSETIIDFEMWLDGTLDGGDVTVNSSGYVSSSSNELSTNFLILANDLTVNTGGKISSDAVSYYTIADPDLDAYDGGGSYAGEGDSTNPATYGKTKLDVDIDTPLYGQAGTEDIYGSTTYPGGGGVRIKATGNILINGTISANGSYSDYYSSGSGGTVMIEQDITHANTSATFSGNGTISANGGFVDIVGGHPGSGGRVVIKTILFDIPDDGTVGGEYDFTGTVEALPGYDSSVTPVYAAAGTVVLLGDDNNTNGTLIVDQGSNDPISGLTTDIFDTGTDADFTFDRVEADHNADVSYQAAPATLPTSCFEINSGTVSGITCTPNPDKPNKLYINNTVTGAQSAAEPSGATPLSVGDLTPNFSVVYANPEDATAVSRVHIQVAEDTDADGILFESGQDTFKWDTTAGSPITISPSITPTQRSQDIEYAGTALSADTVYYVRMAFMDSTNTNRGLWTHRDIGNQYKFIIQNYLDIYPNCAGNEIVIEDANHSGSNIQNAPTRRFGSGSCEMDFLSAVGGATNWYIHFGMASSEGNDQAIAFNDQSNNSGNDINPIDNATKCTMDTTGNTSIEEYAFNISAPTEGTASNDSDVTCTGAFTTGYHDVELYSAMNQIISGLGATTGLYDTFNLNLFANVSGLTVPSSTYTLDMSFIITTTP